MGYTKYNNLLVLMSFLLSLLLAACQNESSQSHSARFQSPEVDKGPHHGRLLKDKDFSLELAIYERGAPPKFRAWFHDQNKDIDPSKVKLSIVLKRLGNIEDNITFNKQGNFLQSNETVYEPHSFVVSIYAKYNGKTHHWTYDNFEGRTQIDASVAENLNIKTEKAGAETITKTIQVYGKLIVPPENSVNITDRFDGLIKQVNVKKGQKVSKGQELIMIESSQNLQDYRISSPIDGIVTKIEANVGEHTNNNVLFELTKLQPLWAELTIFPKDVNQIKEGANVTLKGPSFLKTVNAKIMHLDPSYNDNQSIYAHALVENSDEKLLPGAFLTGEIEVASYPVKLAVKKKALQLFRDFTVVYAKFGNVYEVRMLELGRESKDWVEVLGGLKPGVEYVTDNSYVIKADIEKSGATHDH